MNTDNDHWLRGPVPLQPDNYTSLDRTPWAGTEIVRRFKTGYQSSPVGQTVGESWEFSCGPEMPSHIPGAGLSLGGLIGNAPDLALSKELAGGPGCEILVKLINAASPLSFQIHPEDMDPYLTANECGKPESWLILAAEPGAGIYFGLREPMSSGALQARLRSGTDLSSDLQFVPVRENDYFEIPPGVPHAIGAGVTLLEPQRTLPGKSGKTYRLWDWNRLYDAGGRLVQQGGRPRELHIDAGVRLMRPDRDFGPDFVATLRRSPEELTPAAGSKVLCYDANRWYQTQRVWPGSCGGLMLSFESCFAAVVVLAGKVTVESREGHSLICETGQPLFLPFGGKSYHFCAASEKGNFALITPAAGKWTWQPGGFHEGHKL